MSDAISESTGKRYGIQRVCRAWERARSSVYARRVARAEKCRSDAVPSRRGSKPKASDAALLAAIEADLERSPFQGEGHRKVHARLRILDGLRVSRKRVLRVMRENALLSPHRVRQGQAKKHDGKIVTLAPNLMWGTDGARVFTVDEGWVWIFSAVEHWNAECVGWHVCKVGSRMAALEPIAQGLQRIYGSVEGDAARGLSLRMDHGSQYLSDHFQKQIRFWGITPSFGFVEEPETNGVAERFNRTLKEQAIHGRIFRNVEEVREAVSRFVADYNAHWRPEKLGFKTPLEARQERVLRQAA
jgi:transposase InsO family protein